MERRRFLELLAFSAASLNPITSMAWQSIRRQQGRREVTINFIEQQVSTTNAASYNFTFTVPPPSEGRRIMVVYFGLKNGAWVNCTGITLNSIASTFIYGTTNPYGARYWIDDTTYGSQTFNMTFDATLDRAGMALFEVYGWGQPDETDGNYTGTATTTKNWSFTNIPKGSKIVCVGYNQAANAFTFTGATEIFDVALEASDQASVAILDVTQTGNPSFSVTSSGGAYSMVFVMRSK